MLGGPADPSKQQARHIPSFTIRASLQLLQQGAHLIGLRKLHVARHEQLQFLARRGLVARLVQAHRHVIADVARLVMLGLGAMLAMRRRKGKQN
ncbi:MAG: hypothetical protein ABWY27_03110 [Telluria sp.]